MKKSMRLFGIFVLLLSTVTLMSSCKKDMKQLPGTWKVTSAIINGDDEDNLRDEWTFNSDNTCKIQCDCDEYFDGEFFDNLKIITFDGTYNTNGNKSITFSSDKLFVIDSDYDQIKYDLDIDLLNKKNMIVDGTVYYYQYVDGVSTHQQAEVTLTLSKQ